MHDGAVEKKWRRVISVGGRTPAPPRRRRRRRRAQNFATSGFHFIEASVPVIFAAYTHFNHSVRPTYHSGIYLRLQSTLLPSA